MPVEIRELVIRTVVRAPTAEAADEGVPVAESGPAEVERAESTEAVVQECVRQVMRILEAKRER